MRKSRFTPEQIVGKTERELYPDQDEAQHIQQLKRRAIETKQPRGPPLRGWLLRDELRRKVEIEVGDAHRAARAAGG